MKNGDNTAFPSEQSQENQYPNGLTKREYFAGLAMQGLLAGRKEALTTTDWISERAVKIADELLTQLDK